jgi:hypothetical protein
VSSFETVTKCAVVVSAVAITGLLIGTHPDMTAGLRALSTVAVVAGWLAAGALAPGSPSAWLYGVWAAAGVLAPAILRLATGREGPVLDVFWMAGLTASLLRTSAWSGWSLDGRMRLVAGAWALTIALAWPILAAREAAFDPRLLFDFRAINSWSEWSAPHAVSWIAFVAWTHLIGLLWLDWLAARLDQQQPRRISGIVHGLWIAATVASLVGIYQSVGDLTFLNTAFWAERRRAAGTMLDANAFGVCAALAGPSALVALHNSSWKRAGTIVSLAFVINLGGVWASGSRTALVCAAVSTAAVVLALLRSARPGQRRLIVLTGAGVAAALAVVVLAGGAVGPARRLLERPAGTSSYIVTALSRPPYGPTALEMIREYPLTGVGIGSYHQLAPDYVRRRANEAMAFDNAQNWWRHEAAELGLLGALPLFVWSGLIAWRVLAWRSRPEARVAATVTRGLLLAIGLCSVTQMPTQSPVVLLWFFMLVAWLPRLLEPPRRLATKGAANGVIQRIINRHVLTALAITYAAGHLVLARGPLAVAERAKTFGREYVVGAYGAEPMEGGGGLFRWTDGRSRFVWPARTRWFVIQIWAHHPDIAANPVRVTITTPCGLLLDQTLKTTSRLSVGVVLPEGLRALDATVTVSRTWQPAAYGEADARHLGVAIAADSVASRELALATHVPIELAACGSHP